MIHVFVTWRPVSGGGIFEPCSLPLWQHGRRSGPVLDALVQRAGHTRSYASWELHDSLTQGMVDDVPVAVC